MNPVASAIAAKLARLAWKMARCWAVADVRDVSVWVGRAKVKPVSQAEAIDAGYGGKSPCYRITQCPSDPLRMRHLKSGAEYAIADDLVTDYGSIPALASKLSPDWLKVQPTDARRAYALHDAIYRDGGVWMREGATGSFRFVRCTRATADLLMWQGLSSEPGMNNASARLIYRAVRLGAGFAWRRHAKRRALLLARE
jgi:hypothetical protein